MYLCSQDLEYAIYIDIILSDKSQHSFTWTISRDGRQLSCHHYSGLLFDVLQLILGIYLHYLNRVLLVLSFGSQTSIKSDKKVVNCPLKFFSLSKMMVNNQLQLSLSSISQFLMAAVTYIKILCLLLHHLVSHSPLTFTALASYRLGR